MFELGSLLEIKNKFIFGVISLFHVIKIKEKVVLFYLSCPNSQDL